MLPSTSSLDRIGVSVTTATPEITTHKKLHPAPPPLPVNPPLFLLVRLLYSAMLTLPSVIPPKIQTMVMSINPTSVTKFPISEIDWLKTMQLRLLLLLMLPATTPTQTIIMLLMMMPHHNTLISITHLPTHIWGTLLLENVPLLLPLLNLHLIRKGNDTAILPLTLCVVLVLTIYHLMIIHTLVVTDVADGSIPNVLAGCIIMPMKLW